MNAAAARANPTMQDAFPDPSRVLEALVRKHQVALWRWLRAMGASPSLAEELVQEAFVVAWRKGIEDRGDAAVATFLRTTARHLLLRRWRDEGRREELLVEMADRLWRRDCGEDGDGGAWLAALRECLAGLDGRAREAVKLVYGDDPAADRRAAAARLGLEPNGFKTLLQRVRARLRECVARKLGGEP